MESKNNLIPLYLARKIKLIQNKTPLNPSVFLEECGLYSTSKYGSYYDNLFDGSYLNIKDHRKWMLAKIKYGI